MAKPVRGLVKGLTFVASGQPGLPPVGGLDEGLKFKAELSTGAQPREDSVPERLPILYRRIAPGDKPAQLRRGNDPVALGDLE